MGDPREGRRTPIDIVKQYLHNDFNEAVCWLAEKLDLVPNDYLPKPKDNDQQGSGDPTVEAEITRLAALSTVKYERERKAAAKKLTLRTETLDRLVTNERAKQTHTEISPEKSEQEQDEQVLAELNRDNCVVCSTARAPGCCGLRRSNTTPAASTTSTASQRSCTSRIFAIYI
jgi:hypothetical protein